MTNILLRRFVVIAKGRRVYDEQFHNGLNIIRGQNGSGKSTIIELIYYILGADSIDWKEEALKCDYILGEFEISKQVITIKREIIKDGKPPLSIFWGIIDDATAGSWEVFSMRRSTEKDSFSQVILRLLNIPASIQNEDVSLTMHQLLRILYIDQLSPANVLMRPENFDTIIIREAIVRTLMGAYDIHLLQDEIELRNKNKEMQNYKIEIDKLQYILKENGSNMTTIELRKKINENYTQIQKIDTNLLEQIQISIQKKRRSTNTSVDDIFDSINKAKNEYYELNQRINTINYDITDSEDFIFDLKQRNIDLTNSIEMRKYLPSLTIHYCPLCLNQIEQLSDDGICILCKQKTAKNDLTAEALRLKNELAFQIKESENILINKKKELGELKLELSLKIKQINAYQSQIDSFKASIETTEQQERDKLQFLKGNLTKEIEYLNKELLFQEKIKEDICILDKLKEEIAEFERQIIVRKERLKQNYSKAIMEIQKIAIEFIKDDLQRDLPSDGYSLSKLNIDFEKNNTFSIDDKNNFAASSMVYLKNSILFAFFFASLNLPTMNYPRFIICDNIEDKGMEESRSHQFQLNLLKKSQQYKDLEHQMIITTSMIEPSLNIPEICIGEFYTNESKSLKIEM
jgi:hypothetical protein